MMRSLIIGLVAMGAIVVTAQPSSNVVPGNQAPATVSEGLGLFAGNFFKNLVEENPQKNLVTSPLSASIVLATAEYGAKGNTRVQMCSALHTPSDEALSKIGYQNLISSLNNAVDVTLSVASKIFVNQGVIIKPDFKAITRENFYSEAQQVNFANGAEAAGIINQWVDSQTNHKIKEILSSDDVSADTGLVLSNTLYFKGTWKKKFSDTFNGRFQVNAGTTKNVTMMLQDMELNCGDLPELKAKFIEIPYRNEDFSMMIILPNAVDGLSALAEGLANVKISDIRKRGSHEKAFIWLPKFKIESAFLLNEPLKKMGMTDMFSENADFSAMTDSQVKIDKVVQKAVLEIDEDGSEGAAASALIARSRSLTPSYEFLATHPFLFILQTNDIVLFEGAVMDPEQNI